MSPSGTGADTAAQRALTRPRCNHMPQAAIVVFLLFFAVLAFAWFYLQRAKARTATRPTDEHHETEAAAAAPVDSR